MTSLRAESIVWSPARRPSSGALSRIGLALVLFGSPLPDIALAQSSRPASEAPTTGGVPAEEEPAIVEANKAVRLRQFEKAVAIWQAAANRGSARAAYHLGIAYRSGRGVSKDLARAASWLERAASAGDPDAQFSLGILYRSGLGVPRDPERALDLIGKSARAGNRKAGAMLARIQTSGSLAYSAADPRVSVHRLDPREALSQAIRLNDVGAAREAMARGAPVDGARDEAGSTRPLALAIELDRPALVGVLLENRADPNLLSTLGEPPLILAVRGGNPRIVRSLLSAGASVRGRSKSGASALMEAARGGATEIVESLIAAGADPHETLADGSSAADVARRAGHPVLAQRLQRLGAPMIARPGSERPAPAALDPSGGAARAALPPIVEAARRGDASMLRELLARDGALSVRDAEGDAPLHRAADGGHDDCVRILLDAGADANGRGRDKTTPLMRAMASTAAGSERVVATLLGRGADPHARDASGATALHHAARGATRGKLDRLATAMNGFVPRDVEETLERAVTTGSRDVFSALLERVPSPDGRVAALCAAVVADRGDPFALLVDAGVSLDRDCGEGRSPLMVAVQSGRVDRVKRLLDAGADPDFGPPNADTALISAASRGNPEIVSLLIARHAQVNRRGAHRVTALMGAASNGRVEVVRALLEAGADPRMRSETDQTAVDLAAAAGHQDVVALIRSRPSRFGSWLGRGSGDR